MNDHNIKLTIGQNLIKSMKPNSGLLVKLKKTTSCCSIMVEPLVEQHSIDSLFMMNKEEKVMMMNENNITVAIEKEILAIYPQYTDLDIQLGGFLIKKPKINLPVELIQKDSCTNE